MKKYILFFLIISSFYACSNKSLELPQVAVTGLSGIQNHTEIWVFYKEKNGIIKADVNKNNIISSTHWIVNIDKKLPMSKVIPVMQILKAKRAKKSIHSVDSVFDYLSYSDILDKKIALFRTDTLQYIILDRNEIEAIEKEKPCNYTMEFSNAYFMINKEKYLPKEWRKQLFDNLKKGCVQLHFDKNITYDNYMRYRLELPVFLPKKSKIESIEFFVK